MSTKDRALEAASVAFAHRGVSATSLDGLASDLGVTKQTILYHFGSKDELLVAVMEGAAAELSSELSRALEGAGPGWARVEAVVRASFGLAVNRPHLFRLLREVSRLGQPWSAVALNSLDPLIQRALVDLEASMGAGLFRHSDPRLVLVSAYAAVTGVVTDVELLRAVGLDLDLRMAVRLRRTLFEFLRAALVEKP